MFSLLHKRTANRRLRQHSSNSQMLHESPVLTGHLIYCLRSLSQRTGWTLGFPVPDALLTEQVTSGSSYLISLSLSYPSWRLGEHSPPAVLSFLCVRTCTHAFIFSAIDKCMPGQRHRVTPNTLWAPSELTLLPLQLLLCKIKPKSPRLAAFFSSTQSSLSFSVHVHLLELWVLLDGPVTTIVVRSPTAKQVSTMLHTPSVCLSPS